MVINEVQYNPPQSGPDAAFEWLEVFNRTTGTIHLDGWRIRDNQSSDLVPPLTLPPNGFAIIAATDDFYTNFPDFAGTIVFLDSSIGNGLSNEGDRVILEDSTGKVIDALSYGDDTFISPPCPGVAEGHSLERSPAGGDFVDNSDPTPGFGFSPLPTPTPTPVPTPTPTISPSPPLTPTPTPTPTPQPPAETPPSPGISLRAVLIILAIAFFGIVLLLRRWRRG
ncbi:MAG: lamin tail domain-containing protein [Dehalococcoidia bacterium]